MRRSATVSLWLEKAVWAACATMAQRQIERSETLMHGSDTLEFMRRYIESYPADMILALCAAVLLIFVLVLIMLVRGRRLKKRVDQLTNSVRRLINDEEARYTREILGRTKGKDLI